MKHIIITVLLAILSIAGMCQPSNNAIFTGGNGDGWSGNSYRQPANNIYNGGNGDGWANNSYRQPANNIYNGGSGDGWGSAYLPATSLPVSFLYFTASQKNERAIVLAWKSSREINSSYFEVQKSNDGILYMAIGRIAAAGATGVATDYNFTDQEPINGPNYYRLKQVDLDGRFVYTPSRLVRFEERSNALVKYYPNPTTGILNILVTGQLKTEAKIINVFNATGEVIWQLKAGLTNLGVIPVDLSGFTKGIYFIQVKTATTNSVERIVLH